MIQVFLTNLKEYNNYRLIGDWITLPMDEDELKAKFEELIGDDEYFITDYCDEYGFDFGEYEDIFKLNDLFHEVKDPWCVAGIMEWLNVSFDEAVELQDEYEFIEGMTGERYEEELVEECYDLDPGKLGWVGNYIKIDYKSMADDDESIYEVNGGLLRIR